MIRLTRRELLALMSVSVATIGVSGAGGVLYLLLNSGRRAAPEGTPPAPPATPARPAQIKRIDRPPIVARADWGAREPDHSAPNETGFAAPENAEGWLDYPGDLRDVYRTVVVHHSVLYEEDDVMTMREIQAEHMDKRRWADVGYHFGVGRSGAVFEGRSLRARGTHVAGYNTGSVGVVFFGNFQEQSPTPEQLEAGTRLINWLALRLELTHLAGHAEFNDWSECPGANMIYYLDSLAESAGLARGTGGYQDPDDVLNGGVEESGESA
ncbi:MAG: N-acetylmuramoyl-L-alanine amidase [Chloroflexota bacterium]